MKINKKSDIMSNMRSLKQTIPQRCGVYFFRDKGGRILYIGKALNLRNRVSSYFKNNQTDTRVRNMVKIADRVTWQGSDSEIEALILESQLIKKHMPIFNIKLRDDKQYFYVAFTKEQFPKIFLTHQIQSAKYQKINTKFLGPFTDGAALKTTLRLFRRIFPYCTCKQKHNNYCLNYHIGKCPGFCCLKNKQEAAKSVSKQSEKRIYSKNIRPIKELLSGKRNTLIKNLKKEMSGYAKKEKFNKAIELREKVERLERIFENAQILQNSNILSRTDITGTKALEELKKILQLPKTPNRIEGYDISNIQGKFAVGAMVVFTNGQPDKNQYRKFKIRLDNEPNDIAMLKEIMMRRFRHPEWSSPDVIVIDGGTAQFNVALLTAPTQISVVALTKNERHRGERVYLSNKKRAMPLKDLPESVRNLILQVDAEAHRFAISYYRKLHRKTI
ncbi:MAG: hypothetical protein A2831_01535 [Candidatus Yanofskybacteria bacterium RIFCSPHIGHO2_01_FULL_44_17]|uniref:Excinuclease ABC subunit C n=1 Tax=Candidatus Yanofskybacteria bacterium RIFCSPHIGHO2_01_FULL_44_17 TaxID=1802668 RepID=A0A1F8EYI2_9BACT|nr:MAG: hypothetical protein A2831_01535 [Candidatus Yanofskybacteria bacterium RIFCSPHIGHO2_01_FULL_44_17]